jgi:hypothetical protein
MIHRQQVDERTNDDPIRDRVSNDSDRLDSRPRAEDDRPSSRVSEIHRTHGNQRIQRLVAERNIQRNPTVGQSDDRYEREADRVAERVTRTSAGPAVDVEPADGLARRQRSAEQSTTDRDTARRIESLKGGGRPLPGPTRSFFESRFGRDFGNVRVHTDDRAAAAARSVDAVAFTTGRHVAFRSGSYRPGTKSGRRLLAHELTHVVQQGAHGGRRGAPESDRRLLQRQTEAAEQDDDGEEIEEAADDEGGPCAVTTYDSGNFTGEQIVADRQFVDSLQTIDGYAADAEVSVHVTHSFREAGETPEGAIVEPANRSNHLAGHAIDMNVRAADGVFHNSDRLAPGQLPDASDSVRNFIQDIRNDGGLRWGGDFGTPDPVHIDDHLNASDSDWEDRYDATQQAYREDCY